jgi:hypothetical protein
VPCAILEALDAQAASKSDITPKTQRANDGETATNTDDHSTENATPLLPFPEQIGDYHGFISEGGTMEVERINPVLHCQIGHESVVVGRQRLDLSKGFPGGHLHSSQQESTQD